jgi:hypothetical protein
MGLAERVCRPMVCEKILAALLVFIHTLGRFTRSIANKGF